MADIQVEPELRHEVEQFTKLPHGVEAAGQVLDHESDAEFARERKQLADGL